MIIKNTVKKQTGLYLGLDEGKIKFSKHIKLSNEQLKR